MSIDDLSPILKFYLAQDIRIALDEMLSANEKMKHNSIYQEDFLRSLKSKWTEILEKHK